MRESSTPTAEDSQGGNHHRAGGGGFGDGCEVDVVGRIQDARIGGGLAEIVGEEREVFGVDRSIVIEVAVIPLNRSGPGCARIA